MSSPAETVNDVFAWLGRVFGVTLPTLPFWGACQRFNRLFQMFIKGDLPDPTAPLPWTIPLETDWPDPIPGIDVSIDELCIWVGPPRVISPSRHGLSAAHLDPESSSSAPPP